MDETKTVKLELKQLADVGTFEGDLSVYDVVDATGDVVEAGAFTRGLKNNPNRPMLWQHDVRNPIGVLEITDTDTALHVKGSLNMDVPQAQQAHSMLKFFQQHGLAMGLSIGFQSVRDEVKNGVRYLKEIRLFEGSLVTFPANRLCYVTDVKQIESKSFQDSLAAIQNWQMRQQMMDALGEALMEAFYGDGMSRDERMTACEKACDDFKAAFMAAMPGMMDARGIKQIDLVAPITKEGREIIRTIAEWTTNKARTEPEVSTSTVEPAGKGEGPAAQANDPDPLHSLRKRLENFSLLGNQRNTNNGIE